jgi:hypothetical protein
MKNLNYCEVVVLSSTEKEKTYGGNPILAALGIATTIIGVTKAVDQAAEWFVSGWNDPQ